MLTDNSVVVVDNIYRHMTELKAPVMEAADNGTTEVTMSVIASALTTMVVFIPILFIPGIAREINRDLAYSIIFTKPCSYNSFTYFDTYACQQISYK